MRAAHHSRSFRALSTLCLLATVAFLGACEKLPEAPNVPPVAQFILSPVSPINAGQTTVTFNAAGSRDSDGTLSRYTWNFGDGTGEVSGPDAVITHLFPDTPATCLEIVYTVLLTVADDQGATNSASREAKVVELPTPASFECTGKK